MKVLHYPVVGALLLLTSVAFAPSTARAAGFAVLLLPEGVSSQAQDFPSPPELQPRIEFWKDVFSRHSRATAVIHDLDHLDLVWMVLDLPKITPKSTGESESESERPAASATGSVGSETLPKAGETSVGSSDKAATAVLKVDRKAAKKLIKANLEQLSKRLRRLQENPEPKDEEDRRLLGILSDPSQLRGAHKRLRVQRGIKESFDAGIIRARQLIPQLKAVMRAHGVPELLAVLPLVESAFNPKARSSAGAAGLWQLMPATARELGLKVNAKQDERMNIMKATRAAAKMLRNNLKLLGHWPLAITGYNHGPYGVRRGVKSMGSTDIVYLINNYKKSTWGFASKNFYAEFLAATELLAEHFVVPGPETPVDESSPAAD